MAGKPRFFIENLDSQKQTASIEGQEAKHARAVLRLTIGEDVELFDGSGTLFQATISSIGKRQVQFQITGQQTSKPQPPFLHLGQALLKSKKMDLVVQKATELGAASIRPFSSRFCTAQAKDDRQQILRWQRLALEACKQCGRVVPPELQTPCTFAELVQASSPIAHKFILYEACAAEGFPPSLFSPLPQDVLVLIGSEGGFSPDEFEFAREAGFHPIGLGTTILRAETAAVSALAVFQHLLGHFKR